MKYKKIFAFLTTMILACNMVSIRSLMAGDKLVAFPGAQGGGMYTLGARGAENIAIYHVTNLNDEGEGSLRDALSKGDRIIVFDVAGNIHLKTALRVQGVSNITLLGQTSPGEGICVMGESTLFENCENIIIRYMRFRPGDLGTSQEDGLGIKRCKDFIVDHCSATWSVDEAFSAYANRNFTAQYNIIAQSMYYSVHDKGPHSYGGIWGGENATFHHNLVAHHYSRMPRIGTSQTVSSYNNDPDTDGLVDIRNNVFYNWVTRPGYGGENGVRVNFVGNYYKPGPSSKRKDQFYLGYAGTNYTTVVYAEENIMEGNTNAVFSNVISLDTMGSSAQLGNVTTKPNDQYLNDYPIQTVSASDAYTEVLDDVGDNIYIDSIDSAILDSVKNGTAFKGSKNDIGLIDSQNDVGGWVYLEGAKKVDTDADSIPDEWEENNGLNKNDPNDAVEISNTGYTNIENYANSLVKKGAYEATDTAELRKAIFKAENLPYNYYYEKDIERVESELVKAKQTLNASQDAIDKETETLNALLSSLEYRYKPMLEDYIADIENTDSTKYSATEWEKLTERISQIKADFSGEENNALFKSEYEELKNMFESMSNKYSEIYALVEEFKGYDPSAYTQASYSKAMSEVEQLANDVPDGMSDEQVNSYLQRIREAFYSNVIIIQYGKIDEALAVVDKTWDEEYLSETDKNAIEDITSQLNDAKGQLFDDNQTIHDLFNKTIDVINNIDISELCNYLYRSDFENEQIYDVDGKKLTYRKISDSQMGIKTTTRRALTFDIAKGNNDNVYYGARFYPGSNGSELGLLLGDKYVVNLGESTLSLRDRDNYRNGTTVYTNINKYVQDTYQDYILNYNSTNHIVTAYVNNIKYELSVPEDVGEITGFGFYSPNYFSSDVNSFLTAEITDVYIFSLGENDSIVYGDVNFDGQVDSKDASIVLRHSSGEAQLSGKEFLAGDVNKDNSVDSKDASLILQYTSGSISGF